MGQSSGSLPPEIPAGTSGGWIRVPGGSAAAPASASGPPLRSWLALPSGRAPHAGLLVLPEVFGINGWVRSVAGRLASAGYAALAVPLFARTAPELELGYDAQGLAIGRSHKDQTRHEELLSDLARAAQWLTQQLPDPAAPLGCVGFCFGGHVAMLAATLPQLAASVDCYGAGVVSGSPGGGPPTLERVPQIPGRLLCICAEQDPLMPPQDVEAIELRLAGAGSDRHRLIRVAEAGHGFLCEARADYAPAAAARIWPELMAFLEETLSPGSPDATAR
ncbi:MAG: dienelactone hydrolase family protein [Synechococcus sp. ELA057]